MEKFKKADRVYSISKKLYGSVISTVSFEPLPLKVIFFDGRTIYYTNDGRKSPKDKEQDIFISPRKYK